MASSIDRRRFLAWSALALVGCGGGAAGEPAVPQVGPVEPSPAVPPPPRDTHERAAAIVNAKLRGLLFVDRLADHPLGPRLVRMKAWGGLFEATGIDPLRDVDRAFVAAADARDQGAVIAVAEHRLPEARVEAAMEKLVQEGGPDGRRLTDFGVPAARVDLRGRKSVLLAVSPTLLVVTSDRHAQAATALSATGGLPEPSGPEALIATADRPSETLKLRGAPRVPETVSRAEARVVFADDGSADLHVTGQSTDPRQAKKDAAALTKAIDRATTVKISVVRIRAFDPVKFRSEGDRVEARRRVTPAELSTLIGFAEMAASR